MKFEFDPVKSVANLAKHGIDFIEAQELWDDEDLMQQDARLKDEPRPLAVGRIGLKYWTAVHIYRGRSSGLSLFDARGPGRSRPMKAEEFDRLFDEGGDIDAYVDWSSARRPNRELQRLEMELPTWMLNRLDRQARHDGIERAQLIERWLAERLEQIEEPIAAE